MNRETAISVHDIGKMYPLYSNPRDRLRQSLWYALPRFLRGSQAPVFFKEFWALHEVSFEVRKGESLGIIGENGSGKSTLLQIIAGTLAPTCGEVRVRGRVAALLELGSGFNPEFTGRENVYLNGAILGLSRGEIDARFEDIAAFADIGQYMDQPIKLYSSGMVMRLAFAVIAHVDADILIVDEALAVGDVLFVQKCMRFLRRFRENGTLLMVTHDTAAVLSFCSHAIWLQNGRVQQAGDPKTITDAYLNYLFGQNEICSKPEPAPEAMEECISECQRQRFKEKRGDADIEDCRLELLRLAKIPHDLEIGPFEIESKNFHSGKAEIVDVALLDTRHQPVSVVCGGEMVTLRVIAKAMQPIDRPIIGFYLRDRLGQTLFGDNTYLATQHHKLEVPAGHPFCGAFRFRMPILPAGDFTITVALASGTLQDHEMICWVYDALALKANSPTGMITGLVGVPMAEITLEV